MRLDWPASWRTRNYRKTRRRAEPECADPVMFARDRLGFDPDARQEAVLRARTKRGLLNCTRQWGKSTVTAAKAVHRAWTAPGSLVLVVSRAQRQSGEFVRKAAEFVRRLGVRARGDGDNEISLLLPNGSRIVGIPGMEATVRGFSAVNLLLIDEAAKVPDELYDAVTPMIAVGGGDLWLMSTPNGRRGFFWEEWARGGDMWMRVSVPATECPRIPEWFLAEERRRKTERVFRQEYMCEFADTEAAVFSEDSIQRALCWDIKPLEVPPFEPRQRREWRER
ncbi:MAG TPA: terminase family protein [Bryobacteraceae bacterium]|nr:terminase family protein [Bryobacteraceae bacterium]